jgi:hypothetical protein
MRTILAGVALAAVVATPALADFYVIQDPTTRRCTIVEQRPAPGIGVVIGNPFGVRVEAENHMRTVEVCRETTGRGGSSGDTVIIEKR